MADDGRPVPTTNIGDASSGKLEKVDAVGKRKPVGVFNIANFRSQIDRLNGPARTTLFRVEIQIPSSIGNDTKISRETLTFLTAAVNFPAVRMTTHPIQRYGIGPQEDMPTGFVTNSCDLQILGDADGEVLRFLRAWSRGIVEYQSTRGGVETNKTISNMIPFHVNYKKNYETQITISLFDVTGNQTYRVSLTKAFPKDLGSVYLSWANSDQIMYIPVSFSYFDMAFDNGSSIINGPDAIPQTISVMEKIYSGGAAIQTVLNSLHNPTSIGDAINSIDNSVRGIKALGNLFGI